MIYDCFLFFNEISILEIRLEELYNNIDKFIIIESTKSFSGRNKPLYYNENKDIFKKYSDKIIHIIIDKEFPSIKNDNRWELEYFQRRYIKKVLYNLNVNSDDIIIYSDLDEIIYSKYIKNIIDLLDKYKVVVCNLLEIKYFLNYNERQELMGNIAIKYKNLKDTQELRHLYSGHYTYNSYIKKYEINIKNKEVFFIKNAGLHLGTQGGISYQNYKIQNFSHSECDVVNKERISKTTEYYDNIHNDVNWRKRNTWFNINDYHDLIFDENNKLVSDVLFSCIKNNFNKYVNLFVLTNI